MSLVRERYAGRGLAVARREIGESDIEHVGLHKSLKANGYDVFLNSSSRVTMHWIADDDKKANSTN